MLFSSATPQNSSQSTQPQIIMMQPPSYSSMQPPSYASIQPTGLMQPPVGPIQTSSSGLMQPYQPYQPY